MILAIHVATRRAALLAEAQRFDLVALLDAPGGRRSLPPRRRSWSASQLAFKASTLLSGGVILDGVALEKAIR